MRRKPGEPIYLKRHILGLALAVIAPILSAPSLPPLHWTTEFFHHIYCKPDHRSDREHRTLFRLPILGSERTVTPDLSAQRLFVLRQLASCEKPLRTSSAIYLLTRHSRRYRHVETPPPFIFVPETPDCGLSGSSG